MLQGRKHAVLLVSLYIYGGTKKVQFSLFICWSHGNLFLNPWYEKTTSCAKHNIKCFYKDLKVQRSSCHTATNPNLENDFCCDRGNPSGNKVINERVLHYTKGVIVHFSLMLMLVAFFAWHINKAELSISTANIYFVSSTAI